MLFNFSPYIFWSPPDAVMIFFLLPPPLMWCAAYSGKISWPPNPTTLFNLPPLNYCWYKYILHLNFWHFMTYSLNCNQDYIRLHNSLCNSEGGGSIFSTCLKKVNSGQQCATCSNGWNWLHIRRPFPDNENSGGLVSSRLYSRTIMNRL